MPYGATIIDADGLRLSKEEKALFRDTDPFGFILFARNIDTPDQTYALCSEMREAVGRDAIITIDQEGGRVQRMRAPLWREWPAPLDVVARAGAHAPRAMYIMYRLIADELKACGIDSNCAPLLDVAREGTHPFLRNRCYGTDAAQITAVGRQVADALLQGGVLPVMKHMPGHGRSTVDTHFDLPFVDAPLSDLETVDFAPFRALKDLPMGMTAHLVFTALDMGPATQSAKVMEVIRNDIGFDNLMMTDDSSMQALSGTPAERTQAALAAGVDVVLYCNAPFEVRSAVTDAAGLMTPAAQARAERAEAMRKTPDDIDIPALEREFEALLGGTVHG